MTLVHKELKVSDWIAGLESGDYKQGYTKLTNIDVKGQPES